MSDNNGGGNSFLGFVVGGLVVVVALFAFFVYGDGFATSKKVDLTVKAPTVTAPKTN